MSETKEPKTETTPLGAVGPKRGRRRGRQPENQKLPAEVAKAGRMLSPERMRIVLDSLTEVPILDHAATKAGIHRKTLEYWLRRSAAGDAGYDIEWQGIRCGGNQRGNWRNERRPCVAMTGPTRAGDKSTTPRYGVTLLRWETGFAGER